MMSRLSEHLPTLEEKLFVDLKINLIYLTCPQLFSKLYEIVGITFLFCTLKGISLNHISWGDWELQQDHLPNFFSSQFHFGDLLLNLFNQIVRGAFLNSVAFFKMI